MSESDKRIAPFGLRLPPELKARVQDAATKSNQSMNALIVSLLEREYPQPSVDLHEVAMLLGALSDDADEHEGRGPFMEATNNAMARMKHPWSVTYDMGMVKFIPVADPKARRDGKFAPDGSLAVDKPTETD